MHYRIYQPLRLFVHVAQNMSLSKTARSRNMTKGAVSYQIKQLEQQLGFDVFTRQSGGVVLTRKGAELFHAMSNLFEQAERHIERLTDPEEDFLTIGMTTYFASRWLTPRLMTFTSAHPDVRLRIQPTMSVVDLNKENIDLAIQWGDGNWKGVIVEPLFLCPAFATAGKKTMEKIKTSGLDELLDHTALLHDFDQSVSWEKWMTKAKLPLSSQSSSLVIPDPNVRVEAVINDQGIALNDALVDPEISRGAIFQISDTRLEEFGYFLTYLPNTAETEAFNHFRAWLFEETTIPHR